jgi:hypothetical protein
VISFTPQFGGPYPPSSFWEYQAVRRTRVESPS